MNDKKTCLKKLSILDNKGLDIDLDPNDYGFVSLQEMKQVILNAFNGQLENGLNRMNNAREYINELIVDRDEDDIFEYIMRKYDFEDHPETLRDAEQEYEEAKNDLTSLANCLKVDEFKRMNQFIQPSEQFGIKNIVKEKRLPEDMEREVIGFMGKTMLTGGRKRRSIKSRKSRNTRK